MCNSSMPLAEGLDDGDCNIECEGLPVTDCGGEEAVSLYRVIQGKLQ